MGNELSKNAKERDLARNDSLLSQGQTQASSEDSTQTVGASQPIKRRALPEAAVKKLKSLAELGHGPKGRIGGLLDGASTSRKDSVDRQAQDANASNVTMDSRASEDSTSDSSDLTVTLDNHQQPEEAPANNELPPTPDDDQNMAAPTRPQKALAALSLPSNPRIRAPASPMHLRGKSSTNFNPLQVRIHLPFPAPVLIR